MSTKMVNLSKAETTSTTQPMMSKVVTPPEVENMMATSQPMTVTMARSHEVQMEQPVEEERDPNSSSHFLLDTSGKSPFKALVLNGDEIVQPPPSEIGTVVTGIFFENLGGEMGVGADSSGSRVVNPSDSIEANQLCLPR